MWEMQNHFNDNTPTFKPLIFNIKKMKYLLSSFILIVCCNIGHAQNPYIVDGPGYIDMHIQGGLLKGKIGDESIEGNRLGSHIFFNTLTSMNFSVGVHGFFSDGDFEDSSARIGETDLNILGFDHIEIGMTIGFTIPSSIIMNDRGVPPGHGLPVYLGYQFVDRYSFDQFSDITLDGRGYTIGTQLPIKTIKGIRLGLAIEYKSSTFGHIDSSDVISVINSETLNELKRSGMIYNLRLSYSLNKKQYGSIPENFQLESDI